LADLSVYGGVQSKAKDTERQTDLRALQGQLEAYYAQNGVYPLLSQINTAAWRAQNMRGLDDQALADPDGKKVQLFAAASTGQYGYTASGCDNSGCLDYTLTALLSTNAPFTLQSLNSSVF
jgi:type II secretory pathway pseudopilin PulG